MKKKLLFMIDSLAIGGAQKSLVSLLPLLDRDKYDITLLTEGQGGAFEKLVPQWVSLVYYDQSGALRGIRGKIARYAYSVALRLDRSRNRQELRWDTQRRWLAALPGRYDVAIAYGQGFTTFFVANRVDARRKYAWINADITSDGTTLPYVEQFYRQYDGIVAVSPNLASKIARVFPGLTERLHTVRDVVSDTLVRAMAADQPADAHGTEAGVLRLTTVGRISTEKGYDLLVDAARELDRRGVPFVWKAIGWGTDEPVIRQAIARSGLQQRVQLLGSKENPYPYMRSCDIYVQPSRLEGYGITVAEAKILHKPIVCTCFDVVTDQITDGVNGLVAQMSGESIAQKIIALRDDNALRDRLVASLQQEHNTSAVTELAKVNRLLEA